MGCIMRSVLSLLVILLLFGLTGNGQTKYRSGIFLHHSTGECIWGPNGSATSVPQQIISYNASHSYSGSNAVSLNEMGWPETPWDNEWERWHRIFYNMDTVDADIRPILEANKIIMIKSCFPSSNMFGGVGTKADTSNWDIKSVLNYKWHWRKIIERMRQHTSNFFVVWTNAPLVASATNSAEAANANWFCRWAKDTLAKGLDTEFGLFPKNVYIFDFFHKLTDPTGLLPVKYAASSGDSHPNATATSLVAPQLIKEVFDAAIAYEGTSTSEVKNLGSVPKRNELGQNYPNPFNPSTTIPFMVFRDGKVRIRIFDTLGHVIATLVEGYFRSGKYEVRWNAGAFASGTYLYRLDTPGYTEMKQAVLLK
jgi:hypothetical protein